MYEAQLRERSNPKRVILARELNEILVYGGDGNEKTLAIALAYKTLQEHVTKMLGGVAVIERIELTAQGRVRAFFKKYFLGEEIGDVFPTNWRLGDVHKGENPLEWYPGW